MMSMKAAAGGGGGGGGGGAAAATLGGRSLLSATPPSLTRIRRRTSSFITQTSSSNSSSLSSRSHHLRLVFVVKAVDSTPPSSSSSAAAATTSTKTIVPDNEFTLAKVSFGVIGLGLGISLLSYGFGAYFNILPGSEWSAIMLTYGFPLAIIGMALQYAALKPVPCITYSDAESLREKCATPILKQVRNDVIRFRYGDEQHLEEALKRIFQYGLGGGIPRRSAPQLKSIREEVTEDGKYALVLVFEAKALQLSDFEKRQARSYTARISLCLAKLDIYLGSRQNELFSLLRKLPEFMPKAKFASFFGPGITSKIGKGENDIYEVSLISNTEP